MFIARLRRRDQAPLGAACRPTPSREPDMPLLTELENHLVAHGYKHGAPNGAVPSAQMRESSGLMVSLINALKRGVNENSISADCELWEGGGLC